MEQSWAQVHFGYILSYTIAQSFSSMVWPISFSQTPFSPGKAEVQLVDKISYALDINPFKQIGFSKRSSISVVSVLNSFLSIFGF